MGALTLSALYSDETISRAEACNLMNLVVKMRLHKQRGQLVVQPIPNSSSQKRHVGRRNLNPRWLRSEKCGTTSRV